MKENNEKNASGGIGFVGLLTIAFIVLKLLKIIKWSWFWVLSPVWISFGLGFVLILFALTYAGRNGE